jgi:hypothetical protein
MQILGPEEPVFRATLAGVYRHSKGPYVTRVLTRLALFDPAKTVRDEAVNALTDRPAQEYTGLLLEGLRYPWAPVPQRAADALVILNRTEVVPALIDLLGQPSPADPFEQETNGKNTTVVRELVKINHHHNCLLCHAPGGSGRDLPIGAVPSPAEELPPSSSTAYYAERKGVTVARADVTYLRQDFSMMVSVDDPGPWPKMQRFDFLVRTRVLNAAEVQAFEQEKKQRAADYLSPHQQAVLSALRRLTGIDAGSSASAWRQAVNGPAWSAPPGRVECRK